MPDLARVIAGMAREIEELRRRDRGRSREGTVVEADPGRGLFRVDVGREGHPFVTGWIPAEALSAGALAIQAEPVMGQRVRVTSESGDLTDAVIGLSAFGGDVARPGGPGGDLRVRLGAAEFTVTGSSIVLRVGGTSLTLSAAGLAAAGPALTHGGTNVGRTHTHTHGDPAGTTAPPS
jgi:phage baseplate assembly protein gpV